MTQIELGPSGRSTTQLGFGCSGLLGVLDRPASLRLLEAVLATLFAKTQQVIVLACRQIGNLHLVHQPKIDLFHPEPAQAALQRVPGLFRHERRLVGSGEGSPNVVNSDRRVA